MQKRVFITGISGFAGSYLAEHLVKNEDLEIYGTYLTPSSLENIREIKDKINLFQLDLLNRQKVFEVIKEVSPDLVFHLAALSSPFESFKNPEITFTNNIVSQINLLEAIRIAKLEKTKILIVSSREVYGLVDKKNLPISEEVPLRPTSPYAVSKIAQDFLGLQYFLSYGLKIIRVRPFNHIGPKQSPAFVVSAFSKKIAEIEKEELDLTMKVGNLDVKRDFTDVRDMVTAYDLIMQRGKEGEVYNIGSGVSVKIAEILEKLLSFSKVKIRIVGDESLFMPSDIAEVRCDNTKIKKQTGWNPKIPLDLTLKETLDYWRGIV